MICVSRRRRSVLQTSVVTLKRTADRRDVGNRPVRVVGRQRVQVGCRRLACCRCIAAGYSY